MYIIYNKETGDFAYTDTNTNENIELFDGVEIAEVSDEEYWHAVENNMIYDGTAFVEKQPVVKSKAEQITDIKNYYDKRFDAFDKAVLRRRLANADITDLQQQYKTLQAEMISKIKAVK
nr:MAG TPA: hypothetical protein [Caudoviricetes sp.]